MIKPPPCKFFPTTSHAYREKMVLTIYIVTRKYKNFYTISSLLLIIGGNVSYYQDYRFHAHFKKVITCKYIK